MARRGENIYKRKDGRYEGDTYVIMMFSVRQSTGLFMRTATPK